MISDYLHWSLGLWSWQRWKDITGWCWRFALDPRDSRRSVRRSLRLKSTHWWLVEIDGRLEGASNLEEMIELSMGCACFRWPAWICRPWICHRSELFPELQGDFSGYSQMSCLLIASRLWASLESIYASHQLNISNVALVSKRQVSLSYRHSVTQALKQ